MKALWSYEPFHQDTQRTKSMHQILAQLVGNADKIEVGFISTHQEPDLTLAFDVPEEKRFNEYPKTQIKKELKAAKVKLSDARIKVVEHQVYSTTKVVDRMLELASERNCDLIGLFTHARKGYLRFLVGSFAETTIHRSQNDLLLLNPKVVVKSKVRNVLFASDFGANSKKEFAKVIRYTKNLGAALTVFHHADPTYKWSLDEKNPKIINYRKSVDKMKSWIEDESGKAGIGVNIVVASEFQSTSALIFKLVKKGKIDLIAVCAKSGPMAALMGGSVTRQIVRESSVPVLIIKSGGLR